MLVKFIGRSVEIDSICLAGGDPCDAYIEEAHFTDGQQENLTNDELEYLTDSCAAEIAEAWEDAMRDRAADAIDRAADGDW